MVCAMRNDSPNRRIAGNARAELSRSGISQSTASGALGLSQSALSRRLSGNTPFTAAELSALSALIGVPIATLFELPDHAA